MTVTIGSLTFDHASTTIGETCSTYTSAIANLRP